jgi:NADH:ubiquinone oxidoreductase subunit 4 (subunit M)
VDFVAQELLLNAGISHSVTALVLASAVAACLGLQNLRVFFRLFYGPGPEVAGLGLRPRELLAIVPLAALLVVGGIAPGLVPLLRTAGAVAGG